MFDLGKCNKKETKLNQGWKNDGSLSSRTDHIDIKRGLICWADEPFLLTQSCMFVIISNKHECGVIVWSLTRESDLCVLNRDEVMVKIS